uniref:Polycystic kidney disease 2-like 1 protein n=1 Tax=Zeugodacus cucurbitae TaxID=28588 RepID=A0A0A1X0P9_ZEUCU
MFGIVTQLNIFFVLFVFHTQAHPITNNNDAALVQSGVDNSQLLFEVNGGSVQNTPNAEDTATSADSSPDFRIDEEQLAEYTVHSQAEEGGSSSSGGFRISLLPTQEKTAESVNLEQEGIPSKVLGTYDKTQKKVADLRNLEPIVDTISEHEKYGNNGDMFDGIARSIVNGYEAFSNLLNTLIQKPKDIARSISKGITAQLDIIGGKIVGL